MTPDEEAEARWDSAGDDGEDAVMERQAIESAGPSLPPEAGRRSGTAFDHVHEFVAWDKAGKVVTCRVCGRTMRHVAEAWATVVEGQPRSAAPVVGEADGRVLADLPMLARTYTKAIKDDSDGTFGGGPKQRQVGAAVMIADYVAERLLLADGVTFAAAAPSTPTPEPGGEAWVEAVTEAMQNAWNDYVGDTGCYPDDFTIQGDQLSAQFGLSNFARFVAGWLAPSAPTPTGPGDERPGYGHEDHFWLGPQAGDERPCGQLMTHPRHRYDWNGHPTACPGAAAPASPTDGPTDQVVVIVPRADGPADTYLVDRARPAPAAPEPGPVEPTCQWCGLAVALDQTRGEWRSTEMGYTSCTFNPIGATHEPAAPAPVPPAVEPEPEPFDADQAYYEAHYDGRWSESSPAVEPSTEPWKCHVSMTGLTWCDENDPHAQCAELNAEPSTEDGAS